MTGIDYSRRGRASKRKGERNYCQCGCGTEIPWTSKRRRPQYFAHGHNANKPWDSMFVVEERGYATPCHIWQGGTNENDYGRTKYEGRMQPAHRVALLRVGVTVPEGFQVDHLCRVHSCINPAHLEPVTGIENVRRAAHLTEDAVAAIRAARYWLIAADPIGSAGTPRVRCPNGNAVRTQLAEWFGITPDYVKQLWRGDSWT